MKSNNEKQPIIINNNIQNVNTNQNSNKGQSPKGSKNWSLIVIIGLIASLITIYVFLKDEINGLIESDYDPKVEQGE